MHFTAHCTAALACTALFQRTIPVHYSNGLQCSAAKHWRAALLCCPLAQKADEQQVSPVSYQCIRLLLLCCRHHLPPFGSTFIS